jgi:competence protein ComEA
MTLRISVILFLLAMCVGRSAGTQKTTPATPLDLNSATISQLEKLPGVGQTTAKAIIDFRTRSGPFQRVEDLLAIRGISKGRLEKLRPYVTVNPPTPKSN